MAASQKEKTAASKSKSNASQAKRSEAIAKHTRRRNIQAVVLFAIGLLITALALFGNIDAQSPNVWDYIHGFFCGVFGVTVFFIGPLFIYFSVMIGLNKDKKTIAARIFQIVMLIFLLSAAIQIIFVGQLASPEAEGFGNVASEIYTNGQRLSGGGFCALLIGYPLLLLGRGGAAVIIILIIFVIVMVMANIDLITFLKLVAKPFAALGRFIKRKRDEYEEESRLIREEEERRRLEEAEKMICQSSDESGSERLTKKFNSIDAMTRNLREGEKENTESDKHAREISKINKEAKELVEQQKQESDEFLIKIGAKSPLVPPRLTEEDYKKNEEAAAKSDAQDAAAEPMDLSESGTEENAPKEAAAAKGETPEQASQGNASSEADVQPAQNKAGEIKSEDVKLIGENDPKNNKAGGLNEIEKAIADYNREIEEKNRKNGVVVETTVNTDQSGSQEADRIVASAEEYVLPPVMLLNEIVKKVSDENINAEIEHNATTLVNALKSFGVATKFLEAVRGPSVTRYELQPAPGVKISKITGLVDDISLNLATAGVRIEAPIPNKAAVGIEVPNKEKETVFIREMIDSDAFRKCESKLGSALGKNISGEVVISDIADMPHILIAGTTGAGKSVCVNSIIMSILYRATPDEVRLVMVDPKAVEFMIYNGIGHLLLPVVTDPKKAAGALAWACTEMDKRYNILSANNVRDIKAYNKLAAERGDLPKMPQVVIFIDELADLMMCSKNDVEASICRLAQKARAAGMHLVVATQRPSVDVITGLIKSNIPSRIALKVASQVDSRTIIDIGGAEKLLGKGDMLYKSVAMPKPMRVQGCWVSDEEVERVTEFIKNKFELEYDEGVMDEVERQAEKVGSNDKDKSEINGDLDVSDEKLDEAIDVVFANGGASTSALQRVLKVGYGRAARLVDIMEQMGIVGPQDGNKPRQLLMSKENWYERKLNKQEQNENKS